MSGISAEDALQVAQRALSKATELEGDVSEAEERIAELEQELTSVQLRLSEHDEDRDYDQLTRDDKIGMVREHAFERAVDAGGRAAIDYSDVRWSTFDGEPSPSHCYDLMRWAAGTCEVEQQDMADGVEGFRIRDPENGNRQLVVDADRAKSSREFLAAKNPAAQGEVS